MVSGIWRELLVALEPAGGERLAHRFLDLALRGDADLFQELAQALLNVSSFMVVSR